MLSLEQPFMVCDVDQQPLPSGQVSSPGLLQGGLKRRDVVVPFCWEVLESRSLFYSVSCISRAAEGSKISSELRRSVLALRHKEKGAGN